MRKWTIFFAALLVVVISQASCTPNRPSHYSSRKHIHITKTEGRTVTIAAWDRTIKFVFPEGKKVALRITGNKIKFAGHSITIYEFPKTKEVKVYINNRKFTVPNKPSWIVIEHGVPVLRA